MAKVVTNPWIVFGFWFLVFFDSIDSAPCSRDCAGGELFDHILAHRYLKERDACRLFAQLMSGVHYLHSKHIVHRDLKLVRFPYHSHAALAMLAVCASTNAPETRIVP